MPNGILTIAALIFFFVMLYFICKFLRWVYSNIQLPLLTFLLPIIIGIAILWFIVEAISAVLGFLF